MTGIEGIEEIRLYANRYAVLHKKGKNHTTGLLLSQKEMDELLYAMCGGSIYAHAGTICRGFLSLGNGIRVGICGQANTEGDTVKGVTKITGLIIRLPSHPRISALPLLEKMNRQSGGMLLFAPPGVGKTTLLRAAAWEASLPATGLRVAVIDCRGEFEGTLSDTMLNLCVLSGYPKEKGIEIALRTLSPDLIICDEIGLKKDADAILEGANAGVPILCSAHGKEIEEVLLRPQIQRLHLSRVFGTYVKLERDKDNTSKLHFYTYEEACALVHEVSV